MTRCRGLKSVSRFSFQTGSRKGVNRVGWGYAVVVQVPSASLHLPLLLHGEAVHIMNCETVFGGTGPQFHQDLEEMIPFVLAP